MQIHLPNFRLKGRSGMGACFVTCFNRESLPARWVGPASAPVNRRVGRFLKAKSYKNPEVGVDPVIRLATVVPV
jgi:hypothetical protein